MAQCPIIELVDLRTALDAGMEIVKVGLMTSGWHVKVLQRVCRGMGSGLFTRKTACRCKMLRPDRF